jgi:hypothetical protein
VIRRKVGKKSVDVDYNDWDFRPRERRIVTETRDMLGKYNSLLYDSVVEYIPYKETGYLSQLSCFLPLEETKHLKCRSRSYLRRIFARGDLRLRYGGRFHARSISGNSHQRLRKTERKTITIDGVPTVELDFSCLHPRMLYATKGIQYDLDVYREVFDDGEARSLVKTLVNADLNAPPGKSALRGVANKVRKIRNRIWSGKREKISDKNLALLRAYETHGSRGRELLDRFRQVHGPLTEFLGTGIGLELQRTESDIIMDVMMHFTEQGIVCLPVHDSVIIAAQHADELLEAMQEAYKRYMSGFECPVDRK